MQVVGLPPHYIGVASGVVDIHTYDDMCMRGSPEQTRLT